MDMWVVSNFGILNAMSNASLNILTQAFYAYALSQYLEVELLNGTECV